MSKTARVLWLGLAALPFAWRPIEGQGCPAFDEIATLKPAGQPSAIGYVGPVVALSGGTAVMGAPDEDSSAGFRAGAVYTFDEVPGGSPSWQQTQRLVGSLTATGEQFGWDVAIDADTMVVGAPTHLFAGIPSGISGIAYVFERASSTGVWQETAVLKPDSPLLLMQYPRFGRSVAISGDTIVVGMQLSSDTSSSSGVPGVAFVFERGVGSGWGQTATLLADDWPQAGDFGYSLDVSADIVVVGARKAPNARGQETGAVYVFARNAGRPGSWSQAAKLTASDGAPGDEFGFQVAVDGEIVVASSWLDKDPTGQFYGSAYVFARNPGGETGFVEVEKLVPSGVSAGFVFFGEALDVSGNLILVGAPITNPVSNKSGSVYVFLEEPGGSWEEYTSFFASTQASPATSLGTGVALDGTTALCGVLGPTTLNSRSLVFSIATQVVPASVVSRNAGTNPDSYQASTAVPGQPLTVTCDLTTTGHVAAWFVAFDSPALLPLAGGQTVLCIDQGSAELFTGSGLGPIFGPTASLNVSVPNDQTLCGMTLYSQAVHVGGVLPFALSNAQDCTIGY